MVGVLPQDIKKYKVLQMTDKTLPGKDRPAGDENGLADGGEKRLKPEWLDPGLLLLFLGSYTVYANLHLAFILMPLYVPQLGGTEWTAAWHNALFAGSAVVFRLLLVSWVDRYGRKFCLILSAAALVATPLLIPLTDSLAVIALIRLVQGLGLALYPLTADTLVADLTPPTRRGTAFGLLRLVTIVSLITAPPAASWIVNLHGFQAVFLVIGLAGVAGAVPLVFIREPVHTCGELPAFSRLWTAFSRRPLQVLFASTAACGLAYGVVLTFLPLYAGRAGIDNFGLFFTIFALSGLLSALLAGRLSDSLGRKVVLLPALVLFGTGTVFLSWLAPGAAMVTAAVAAGSGYAASLTLLAAWVIDEAGPELRTASLGLFENGIDVGITLGSFTFGTVIALFGYGTGFAASGILLILFALLAGALRPTPESGLGETQSAYR